MTRGAGTPPTWPVAGSGDNATAVGLYSAIVTALYRRAATPLVKPPTAAPVRAASADMMEASTDAIPNQIRQ